MDIGRCYIPIDNQLCPLINCHMVLVAKPTDTILPDPTTITALLTQLVGIILPLLGNLSFLDPSILFPRVARTGNISQG